MDRIDGLAHLQTAVGEACRLAVQAVLGREWRPAVPWASLWRALPLAASSLAACNGHGELCGKRYSDVTFVGSHNSAFVGPTPTHNQYVSVTDQLNLGVRFLQAQTHDKGGTIEMCHTYCWELDSGPLARYLGEIAAWMDGHPGDVVTLLLTNEDAIPVGRFDDVFGRTGLKRYAFRPRGVLSRRQWPTLRELIDAQTRLVVFMDYFTDQTEVDYLISEFDYFWETPYGVTDKMFPTCSVDRPFWGDPQRLMGIVNHMLNVRIGGIVFPDQVNAKTTNSLDSITKQVVLCESQGKPRPNVILLDYINVGEAQQAQLKFNGLA
ncbi:uncharacterized protein UV8b_00341 [Ustilaginoidea virens]|uniref:PLC-like phosphodiesterase n=1 Tax=Ustilaginoidea virens TaxID=1159556 RepID=A0A8E5HIK2_USTVR|nr:uncharacterized protein UV8b_00341 [Ustilaginoidea virens]QUC16100.1 hypothetical protein UV8b_00341 [Ustilaginoidea virens]